MELWSFLDYYVEITRRVLFVGLILSTSLEECTYIVNGSDTFGGDDSSFRDLTFVNEKCVLGDKIKLSRNWYGYIARFRMRAQESRFDYRVTYSEADCCLKMLLYLEPQVEMLRYHMSCLQMQSVLDPTSPQVIALSPNAPWSGCKINTTSAGKRVVHCAGGRVISSDIERNWYIAISSCGAPHGLDFEYTLDIRGWVESEGSDCPSSSFTSGSARWHKATVWHRWALSSLSIVFLVLGGDTRLLGE